MGAPEAAVDADAPFADLPQAMVDEMLASSRRLAAGLASGMAKMHSARESIRGRLAPLIGRDADAPQPASPPTTAGIDGSHCADRLLATDIVAMAAVAVEGLAPGGGGGGRGRLWPRPRHFVHVESVAHDDASPVLARAIMSAMEVQLAALAPHDVVFVDGSLATPAVALDIALSERGGPRTLARYLEEGGGAQGGPDGRGARLGPIGRTLSDYLRMLVPPAPPQGGGGGGGGGENGEAEDPPRSAPVVAAVAKYSQRNELCRMLGMPNLDDRGLLSLALEPGEYVGPVAPARAGGGGSRLLSCRIPGGPRERALAEAIADAANAVRVMYYRPYPHSPAIRIEVGGFGGAAAGIQVGGSGGDAGRAPMDRRTARLVGTILAAVKAQSSGPGLMEPYPLYMADRMAKSLPRTLPAMRCVAVSAMSSAWGGAQAPNAGGGAPPSPAAEMYLAARGYRT